MLLCSYNVLHELQCSLNEKGRQSVEDGPLIVELMWRVHCVAMALKTSTSMDSYEDATACYELKMPVMCPMQPLSCWDSLKK